MGRAPRIDDPRRMVSRDESGCRRTNHVFTATADRVSAERLLGVGDERFGVEVHAYCLMPKSLPPAAALSDGRALGRDATVLGSVVHPHVNERIGRDGPIFRGRFHSIPIQSETADRSHRRLHSPQPDRPRPTSSARDLPVVELRAVPRSSSRLRRGCPGRWSTSCSQWRSQSSNGRVPPARVPWPERVTKEIIDRIVGARIDLSCPDGKRLRLLLGFEVAELTAQEVADWIGLTSAGAARTALSRARATRLDAVPFDALVAQLEAQVRAAM